VWNKGVYEQSTPQNILHPKRRRWHCTIILGSVEITKSRLRTQSVWQHQSRYGAYRHSTHSREHLEMQSSATEFPLRLGGGRVAATKKNLTGQYQATFGISIIDLDRLPVHRIDTANANISSRTWRSCRITYMSPGLLALGPGIFSVRGVMVTKLTLVASAR
jgi:hypothetical protein